MFVLPLYEVVNALHFYINFVDGTEAYDPTDHEAIARGFNPEDAWLDGYNHEQGNFPADDYEDECQAYAEEHEWLDVNDAVPF